MLYTLDPQQLLTLQLKVCVLSPMCSHFLTSPPASGTMTQLSVILIFFFLRFHVWASLVPQMVKNLPALQETWVRFLGWEDPLEEGRATDSSILAWRITMDRGIWWAPVHGVAESDMIPYGIYFCVASSVLPSRFFRVVVHGKISLFFKVE